MSLLDSLGKAAKSAGKAIKETADNIAEERRKNEARKQLKIRILERYEMSDLRGICAAYGIGNPAPYTTDPITGEKEKRAITGDVYIQHIIYNVTLEQIKLYSEKHHIRVYDLLNENEPMLSPEQSQPAPQQSQPATIQPQMEVNVKSATPINIEIKPSISEFDEILNAIKNEYEDTIRDQFFRDEDAFNDNLVTFLKTKFGNRFSIENTRRRHGDTGDILINGKYVLEQKYADNPGTLNQGLGEVKRYKVKRYSGIAFVILDTGKITNQVLEFKKYYEEEGAKVIIIRGLGERKKQKPKFFVGKM